MAFKDIHIETRDKFLTSLYIFLENIIIAETFVTYKCDFETEIEENCFLVESTDDDFDFTREMV